MKQKATQIDPDKFRAAVRRLGNEQVYYMLVLSATAEPEEYAKQITAMLSRHYSDGRDKMLPIARRTATPEQRKALAEVRGT